MFKLQSKITPFLWYDNQAGDAAALYIRLFGNGRVVHTQHWGEGTPYPVGSVMAVSFELHGQPLIAFNGGPHFKLNEAASLFVQCDDQAEVDKLWDGLIADGGAPSPILRTEAADFRILKAIERLLRTGGLNF